MSVLKKLYADEIFKVSLCMCKMLNVRAIGEFVLISCLWRFQMCVVRYVVIEI